MSTSKQKCHPLQGIRGLSEAEIGESHVVDRTDTALALTLNLNQWNTAIPVVISIDKNVVGLGKETREGFADE